jgi:hypothetical protein
VRLSPYQGVDTRGAQTVSVVRLQPLYDCAKLCGRYGSEEGDPLTRAAMRCSLPGYDCSRWDPEADPRSAGIAETMALSLHGHAEHAGIALDFELARDGCPRGWADSAFGASVMRYAGARSLDSPIRSRNLRLEGRVMRDPEPPERLLDMVDYGVAAEDNCYIYFHEVLRRT